MARLVGEASWRKAELVEARAELRQVSKSFGGVQAVDEANLLVRQGTVHALVGENGAGKSTLIKMMTGVLAPDSGALLLRGAETVLRSPRDALANGIALIAQELSIVPALTVAANICLGDEPQAAGFIRRRELLAHCSELIASSGFDLSPRQRAGRLRVADQQKVEILRAINRNADLFVMDEPSAALASQEVGKLHAIIRSLAAAGKTVVLISHHLDEVLALADTVTVLRDGRVVRTTLAAEETEQSLVNSMLGRSLGTAFPPPRHLDESAPVVLSVRGLKAHGVNDVSFDVRAGEIVGLAGLIGAGRSEAAHAVFGATRSSGEVAVSGQVIRARHPWQAMKAGIAIVPESRKEQGLLLDRSTTENVMLSALSRVSRYGHIHRRAERRIAAKTLEQVTVRSGGRSSRLPVRLLSGGNQQKVLFGRTLLREPRVVIADEPTRGVDVASKRAIYDLLVGLADTGVGVLLISSEIEEILGLSQRVIVMARGRVVGEFVGELLTEANILAAAFRAPEPGDAVA